MSEHFYADLAGFQQFSRLADPAHYTAAPEDWSVAMTDVRNSTKAIEQGQYKEVNMVSAAAIMAILNTSRDIAIPYVFGGDGGTILLPPSLAAQAHHTLSSVQAQIKRAFGLELRAGIVPLKILYQNGAWLKVARFQLSPHVSQAVFQGTALSLAEQWLKTDNANIAYCHEETPDEANLRGLECRWKPIENRNGEILSLMVKATSASEQDIWRIYDDVLRDIDTCYPDNIAACPTYVPGMHLSLSPKTLRNEVRMRGGKTTLRRYGYLLKILLLNSIGKYCIAKGKQAGTFDGKQYLSQLVANSDFRKCDEMLRMVIDSTPQQHELLEKKLRQRLQRGEIVYGLHVSPRALMTCLVFSLDGNHVHFIDGSDGGYALAAQQMKQQAMK